MTLSHSALSALLLFGLAHSAAAQQGSGQRAPAQPVTQEARVDVNRLPVNLQRIQRELAQSTREREERDGVNLRYIIDVFGQAPPIEIFTREDNLINGPVPYGAPTHAEMIYMMTPQEFRSPVMDFSALFRRMADKKSKK
jgi:hypothetical protein